MMRLRKDTYDEFIITLNKISALELKRGDQEQISLLRQLARDLINRIIEIDKSQED
jgi:hypothetical protein